MKEFLDEETSSHFSAWKASVRLAALDASIVGIVVGAAVASGIERFFAEYHPLLNWVSIRALNHELVEQYNPHLVTPETIVSAYRQVIFPLTLVASGIAGLTRGFSS